MKKLLQYLAATFYLTGILTFIILLNRPTASIQPISETTKHITEVITKQVNNSTLIDVSGSTIGAFILAILTLLIIVGSGYAYHKSKHSPSKLL